MQAGFANLIQIAVAAIALFGVALSVGRPRLHAATALMVMAAAWMVFNVLEEAAGFRSIWLVTPAFRLLLPPLFFLLVKGLIVSGPTVRPADALHLLPFLIGLALTRSQLDLVEHAARLSLVIYAGASAWLVHRFHRTSPEQRSDAARIRLNLLYGLIGTFVGVGVFDSLRMDARWLHDDWPWLASEGAYLLQLTLSLAMTAGLIFLAVRRETLFEGLPPDGLGEAPAQPATGQDLDPSVFDRIERALHQDGLYTEPRLTRAEVAAAAGLSERQVSQAIRQATGQNFNDYINRLRLRDVCAMLEGVAAGQSSASVLEIAFTAGFSSKSVFNAAFKRAFGQTPTAWLAARRNDASRAPAAD